MGDVNDRVEKDARRRTQTRGEQVAGLRRHDAHSVVGAESAETRRRHVRVPVQSDGAHERLGACELRVQLAHVVQLDPVARAARLPRRRSRRLTAAAAAWSSAVREVRVRLGLLRLLVVGGDLFADRRVEAGHCEDALASQLRPYLPHRKVGIQSTEVHKRNSKIPYLK